MSQIFISYSRRDTQVVDQMVAALSSQGLDVWIDRQAIQAGNSWRLQIVEAIDACDVFVLALSPNSAASDNVRKEIDLAQDAGRFILPVMLEPVKIPAAIRYQLAGLQFIDMAMLGFDQALEQLVEISRQELAKKKLPQPETKTTEVVIEGVDLASFGAEKQKQLLEFIANLTQTNQTQLRIANLAAGSVHAFVEMPPQTARQLKTLALNHDQRVRGQGIVLLRVVGDASFINVASGLFVKNAPAPKPFWTNFPALTVLAVAIIAGIFMLFRAFVFDAPTAKPLPVPTRTVKLISTSTPLLTFTPPPTLTALPTQMDTETPTQTTSRCPLFENKAITFTTLKWFDGTPLGFYFNMTGGIPGLEDKSVNDGHDWQYTATIDGHITRECEFIEGYRERLYCTIDLPASYAYSLHPLTLTVNGCDTPIYHNPIAEVPKIKIISSGGSCGAAPDSASATYSSWCTCMGGAPSRSGACITP